MDGEIQLISDGDGLAVIGNAADVGGIAERARRRRGDDEKPDEEG